MKNWLKRMGAAALSGVMLLALAACGGNSGDTSTATQDDSSSGEKTKLYVVNWKDYASDDEELMAQFEEEYHCEIVNTYMESEEQLLTSLKTASPGTIDVCLPNCSILPAAIKDGLLKEIDTSKLENFSALYDRFQEQKECFGEDGKMYAVPFVWGSTAIAYNTELMSEAPNSLKCLFDEQYAGKLTIRDDYNDAIMAAAIVLGQDPTNPNDLDAIKDLLIKQKEDGIVQAYVMDQIFDKMINNEAAMGTYYAGDYLTMVEENPDLAFVQPEEGSNLFVDAMCIPTCSKNYEDALAFINFMCRDDIVLRNCEETGYSCPSATALEEMDEEMAADPVAYPGADILDKAETFGGLPEKTLTFYDHEWIRICLAKVKY